MARLFITGREQQLISFWTSEIIKDCVGEVVYLYSISRAKSKVHDVYDEAIKKVFEDPIKLDALVDWQASEPRANEFGLEQVRTIKVYVQAHDLIAKNIEINEGDFVSYGVQFYEIVASVSMRNIYGQVEYTDGIELICEEARQSQFISKVLGPTSEAFDDEDAIRQTFVQQRGFDDNSEGPTGDKRDLIERGILEPAISLPREVSPKGDMSGSYSFYDGDT